MSEQSYLLVSLPTSITSTNDQADALEALDSTITSDLGNTDRFSIPEFKVGTLDALVQHADDLAKLENTCRTVVSKIADALRIILDGDEQKVAEQKTVNDRPVDTYLSSFQWNRIKYRSDKPIAELSEVLERDISGIDNDVRGKLNQYTASRTALSTANRGQTGNLSQKSLASVVNPNNLMKPDASEYLQQHLLAVPKSQVKEYLASYESLVEHWVVPRSSIELAKDDEYTLFAVTVFKKYSTEFLQKAREKRWVPREWKFREGGKEAEREEVGKLEKEERKLWGEALRLARTGYSDAVQTWVHVLVLRVFVETVLRYGLPLSYVCGLVKTTAKNASKAKAKLDQTYSHLGGNALGRDKNGRPTKDDSSTVTDMQSLGHGSEDYTPYVFYQFEI